MGEENTGAENTEEQSEDTGQDDTGSGEGENESEENAEDGAEGEENQGDDDEEPPVRKKTAKDYIIERKNKKIEKLKNKKDDGEEDDGDSDEDDDVSPEDEKVVDKIIQKKYGDKFAKLDQANKAAEEAKDQGELKQFLTDNPNFKPFEKKIWKHWQHPSRNHLPLSDVVYAVAGPQLLKLGAKLGAQADNKARKTSSGGNSARNAGGKIDYSSMTDAEFDAHVEKVKQRQRD
jgi:hypothetical protein